MDDWQVGDLALCVSERFRPGRYMPRRGQICTVVTATHGRTMKGLVLAECPTGNPLGWRAMNFRKINPLSIEERNAEIRILTGKPVEVPA